MSGVRPIWLTEAQIRFFAENERGGWHIGALLETMWLAAPPDATEAVELALDQRPDDVARAVLRALGEPQ